MASLRDFALNYGALDRLVHRVAFRSKVVQAAAAELEDSMFRALYAHVRASRPVFVTSLPRAGTTLLLEALHRFPSLASQVYRDMPFVLAPLLWSRFSTPFQRRTVLRERAHGDGMRVGYDSPEAFEEVFWRFFWPEKYKGERIPLWQASDRTEDSDRFLEQHMKKVVALRRPERANDARYISKNNANVARLDLLASMFPDASIVVPFRNPMEHAISLLRQHENFLELHRRHPFTREYMADLGHFEFGMLHKPIEFPRAEELTAGHDPTSLGYWLGYWIAAFEYVLARRDLVVLVSYEHFCEGGGVKLAELCRALDVPEDGGLERAAQLIGSPPPPRRDAYPAPPELRTRAEQVYDALLGAEKVGAPSAARRP
jgi:hypothetical protein